MKKEGYFSLVEKLFAETKSKRLQKDPTFTRLSTLRNYINTLLKRGEMKMQMKEVKPTAAQIGRVHGLPKTHKSCTDIPNFRPVINYEHSLF